VEEAMLFLSRFDAGRHLGVHRLPVHLELHFITVRYIFSTDFPDEGGLNDVQHTPVKKVKVNKSVARSVKGNQYDETQPLGFDIFFHRRVQTGI
jgi:hypothetical protein